MVIFHMPSLIKVLPHAPPNNNNNNNQCGAMLASTGPANPPPVLLHARGLFAPAHPCDLIHAFPPPRSCQHMLAEVGGLCPALVPLSLQVQVGTHDWGLAWVRRQPSRQSLLALASAHMNVTLAAGAHLRVSQAGTALTMRAAVGDE